MTGNSSNTTSSGVPEETILREYFDKKGIEKLIPDFIDKLMNTLEQTEETKTLQEIPGFTGNLEALEKSGLEAFDIGEPTCPDIIVNKEGEASETEPQAWEYEGKWYYNWKGAMKEAEFLGKKLPTKKYWKKICKPYGDDGKRMAKELGLSFAGYRGWDVSSFSGQNKKAFYWSSNTTDTSSTTMIYAYNLRLSVGDTIISPDELSGRAFGYTLRLLKN